MITLLFPPGCYGNFFASAIYEGTSLSIDDSVLSKVDSDGSLHDFRNNSHAKSKIQWGHLHTNRSRYPINPARTIAILPCLDNRLDYIDNQLTKQTNSDVLVHIRSMYESTNLQHNVSQFQHVGDLSDMDPWILREFISFWILDMLNNAFIIDSYTSVGPAVCITTNDIFLKFEDSLDKVTSALGLESNRRGYINDKFDEFKRNQKFHGIQQRCDDWVNQVLNNKSSPCPCPCITVFDEAYVQAKLRLMGFEIRCYQLDEFPKESLSLAALLYSAN